MFTLEDCMTGIPTDHIYRVILVELSKMTIKQTIRKHIQPITPTQWDIESWLSQGLLKVMKGMHCQTFTENISIRVGSSFKNVHSFCECNSNIWIVENFMNFPFFWLLFLGLLSVFMWCFFSLSFLSYVFDLCLLYFWSVIIFAGFLCLASSCFTVAS